MSGLSVFIAVTHLLGVGHLSRAAAIGRALAEAGHRVTLASGGRPAPVIDFGSVTLVQLPPVHCRGTDFRTLYGADDAPVTGEDLERRQETLVAAFAASEADVVITELFPFGRRQLAGEMLALLEAARATPRRPSILCSIRDILNPPSKPERAVEALERLGAFYDAVLVHADPAVAPLSLSWPVSPVLERRLFYTGYIAGPTAEQPGAADGEDEVLVTASGGSSGLPLYRAAVGAAALAGADGPRWRILVGHGVAEADLQALKDAAPRTATVERARTDFRALLARSAAVVAQAGYNTVIELAQARARAVLVPFDEGQEREQGLRAELFRRLGLAETLPAGTVSPQSLLDAVRRGLARPRPAAPAIDLDGLAQTVAAVETAAEWARERKDALDACDAALDRARETGTVVRAWWRDDDAVAPTAALDRLLELRARHAVPLTLAVIPSRAEPALAERLAHEEAVSVAQHGFSHANHAPPDQKKLELGHCPLPLILGELQLGAERLARLFADRFLPVLVPPWNRMDPQLLPALPGLGLAGLSTYGPRKASEPVPGILQVNTHWDPIAWRNGGGLADPALLWGSLAAQITVRTGVAHAEQEPLGLLTHHLVHDPWIWTLLEDVLQRLTRSGVVAFETPWAQQAPASRGRAEP